MEWFQVASIIGTVLLAAFAVWKEVKGLEAKIDTQSARTDKLYEMFIDLVKETRK